LTKFGLNSDLIILNSKFT